jgi:hypothetical protein
MAMQKKAGGAKRLWAFRFRISNEQNRNQQRRNLRVPEPDFDQTKTGLQLLF